MPTFDSIARLDGKTAVGIPVPEDVVLSLNAGKRVPVSVTVNGFTYRSTVSPYKGEYMIALSAENRVAAGVEPNDAITVTLEVDTAPRVVEVPADLQTALDGNPAAQAAFTALSYSNQRAHVQNVEAAKAADTRAQRIETIVVKLGL